MDKLEVFGDKIPGEVHASLINGDVLRRLVYSARNKRDPLGQGFNALTAESIIEKNMVTNVGFIESNSTTVVN